MTAYDLCKDTNMIELYWDLFTYILSRKRHELWYVIVVSLRSKIMSEIYHISTKSFYIETYTQPSYLCITFFETFPRLYKRCPINVDLPASTCPETIDII